MTQTGMIPVSLALLVYIAVVITGSSLQSHNNNDIVM